MSCQINDRILCHECHMIEMPCLCVRCLLMCLCVQNELVRRPFVRFRIWNKMRRGRPMGWVGLCRHRMLYPLQLGPRSPMMLGNVCVCTCVCVCVCVCKNELLRSPFDGIRIWNIMSGGPLWVRWGCVDIACCTPYNSGLHSAMMLEF